MDDWTEAVRKAIEDDPDHLDHALLIQTLDKALGLLDAEHDVASLQEQPASMRQKNAEFRAVKAGLAAVNAISDQFRKSKEWTAVAMEWMAADIQVKTSRIRHPEATQDSSGALVGLR